MRLDEYLENKLDIDISKAREIAYLVDEYQNESKRRFNIKIPNYTLGEELFNSISHGIGAVLSVIGLILLVIKAHNPLPETAVSLFGATMIILYTISCIYHALSPKLEGKKILRVIDHCNVYLLVFGTYIPTALLGIGGLMGWIFFIFVFLATLIGIIFTCISIDKTQVIQVICHLVSGWAALIAIPKLLTTMGNGGLLYLILGGVMYTIGSILYGLGKKKKYMHSVFHVFCLLGTFCHFWCIYMYLI